MQHSIKILTCALLIITTVAGCSKTDYSFGNIKTPIGLNVDAVVDGADQANPNGNGSGRVAIAATATNALSYKIDYGDGTTSLEPSGIVTHKYTTTGTNTYTITVNAIGTAGAMSTISKQVTVFVAFSLPADIMQNLTNGGSRIWITDREAAGHFGVGPATDFSPIWYAAAPNSREACAYDDEITFSKDANGKVSMTVDNKGTSFSIAAATAFYGMSGGDNCYSLNTGGTKQLSFMTATSGSTSANSRQIELAVPGNGIINFGTGATKYEILSITDSTMHLRNIGADGNSWYQKLKAKS
ncbi:hypothetical protein FAM09_28720 [Niastella caeni]|uniref:PKD domain-containing protein n=1 Tax=Niastella caeni TaxID=2569763 RepID=A0A4S8HBY0_9BACT|nr:PKD domain-containing protein [Niastella caeni]THU31609.1 hypothetical protein FAM09_28720 [Niastella caeni]